MAEGAIIAKFAVAGTPKGWQRAGQRIVYPKGKKPFVSNYTQAQTRSEEEAIKWFANVAMQGRPPHVGPVDVRMCFYVPVPASWSKGQRAAALAGVIFPTIKPDLSNFAKLAEDSMNGVVYVDDAQIVDETLWKRYAESPRVSIEVRERRSLMKEAAA